jgi:predicted dehydrogenase
MKENVRIAVIGAGWWACESHIPHILKNPNAELVSVCRLGTNELENLKKSYGIMHLTEDHREVYTQNPHGVVVASPHVLHFEHASTALENRCHVLLEKPMVTDTQQAKVLCNIVKESGKVLMTPYGLNYSNYMEKAADKVAEGCIGEIKHIVLHMSSALLDLFAGESVLDFAKNHMYQPSPSTWSDPLRAGGYGWGQMSHALAALFFVADLEPLDVHAITSQSPTGADYYDAAIIRFTQGATGSVSGAAGLPKHCPAQLEFKLFGSEGMLLLDMEEGRERLQIRRFDQRDTIHPMEHGEGFGAYSTEESVNRFIKLCQGVKVRNCGDQIVGLKTVQVLDALYKSSVTGETVLCK